MQTTDASPTMTNVTEKEAKLPEYQFYQHICECKHGQIIHDYKIIPIGDMMSEREHLNCRYPGCECTKYIEDNYSG